MGRVFNLKLTFGDFTFSTFKFDIIVGEYGSDMLIYDSEYQVYGRYPDNGELAQNFLAFIVHALTCCNVSKENLYKRLWGWSNDFAR